MAELRKRIEIIKAVTIMHVRTITSKQLTCRCRCLLRIQCT